MNPTCPKCGATMVGKENRVTGQPFWGCSTYPKCKGIIPFFENKNYGRRVVGNRTKVTGYIRGKSQRYYNGDPYDDMESDEYGIFPGDPNDYGDS